MSRSLPSSHSSTPACDVAVAAKRELRRPGTRRWCPRCRRRTARRPGSPRRRSCRACTRCCTPSPSTSLPSSHSSTPGLDEAVAAAGEPAALDARRRCCRCCRRRSPRTPRRRSRRRTLRSGTGRALALARCCRGQGHTARRPGPRRRRSCWDRRRRRHRRRHWSRPPSASPSPSPVAPVTNGLSPASPLLHADPARLRLATTQMTIDGRRLDISNHATTAGRPP